MLQNTFMVQATKTPTDHEQKLRREIMYHVGYGVGLDL